MERSPIHITRLGDIIIQYSEAISEFCALDIEDHGQIDDAETTDFAHHKLGAALCLVVAEQRESLNISQGELARRSGLNRSFISDLERGTRNLSVITVSRLAQALEMPVSSLFLRAEKKLLTI